MFSKTPVTGLTATATKQKQQKIVEAMAMISPFVIDVIPDRKNIYFSSSRRGIQGDEKLVNILDPLLKGFRCRRRRRLHSNYSLTTGDHCELVFLF